MYNMCNTNTQIQNTGGLSCFRQERFINFLTSVHGDTRRETQFLKVFANHTMLTPLQRAAHLVMFKISVHLRWSRPEKLNHRRNSRKLNSLPQWSNLNWLFFKILKFSGPSLPGLTSFTLQPHLPVWGFIMTNGDCHILCVRA